MDRSKSPTVNKPPIRGARSPSASPTAALAPTMASMPFPATEQRVKARHRPMSLEPVLESDFRAPRGSRELPPIPSDDGSKATKMPPNKELARRRSQYFHEALHERNGTSAAGLVRGEAMVLAELKTNVKIRNEHQVIAGLSEHLAARYNRQAGSVIVVLEHSRCMLFGGTAQPAYTMSISALPSEVQTATNKRNTVVIQKHIEVALQVPSARGLIRFIPVSEECLGWGGKTVAGQIARATGRASPDLDGNRTQERRILKSLSLRRPGALNATPPSTTPEKKGAQRSPSSTPTPAPDARTIRKKKSIIRTLFRSSRHDSEAPPGPQAAGG